MPKQHKEPFPQLSPEVESELQEKLDELEALKASDPEAYEKLIKSQEPLRSKLLELAELNKK